MKTISARELQQKVRGVLDAAQKDRVVVTRRGQPVAVLVGVEGKDWEHVVLETSRSFWRLIRRRRKQRTVSLEDLRRELR